MKSSLKRRAVIVGLFLLFGLVILVAGIMVLGNMSDRFIKKFNLITVFEEVNGLQAGNNIWFSGVKVGTIKSLSFYGKSQVLVDMQIDREAQSHIRKDAHTKISTDGLIGNKIVVIFGGSDEAPAVKERDTLLSEKTLGTEDMMITLQENNKNLLAITGDIKAITGKIRNGEGTLGRILTDDTLYSQIGQTVEKLNRTASNAEKMSASLAEYTGKMNTKGNLANDLVTDTVLFNSLTSTINELRRIVDSAAGITANLQKAASGLNDQGSPAGVLLHDQPTGTDLKATMKNLETATQKLNEDLEALKHNFLFKRYFKKQEKEK
jgi:phospholipid/cholesterol/gamma-HCH transport system substrate-binding protein